MPRFERLANTISRDDEPPRDLMQAITSCVHLIFGSSAKLTQQGSYKKGTTNLNSDFDFLRLTTMPTGLVPLRTITPLYVKDSVSQSRVDITKEI